MLVGQMWTSITTQQGSSLLKIDRTLVQSFNQSLSLTSTVFCEVLQNTRGWNSYIYSTDCSMARKGVWSMQACIYQVKQAQSLHSLCAFLALRWVARQWGVAMATALELFWTEDTLFCYEGDYVKQMLLYKSHLRSF